MAEIMLTTFDNPYSPFDDFRRWFNFDVVHGYNTCQRLANIEDSIADFDGNNLPDFITDDLDELAMHNLVDADPLNLFQIVTAKDYENGIRVETQDTKELKEEIEKRESQSGE